MRMFLPNINSLVHDGGNKPTIMNPELFHFTPDKLVYQRDCQGGEKSAPTIA